MLLSSLAWSNFSYILLSNWQLFATFMENTKCSNSICSIAKNFMWKCWRYTQKNSKKARRMEEICRYKYSLYSEPFILKFYLLCILTTRKISSNCKPNIQSRVKKKIKYFYWQRRLRLYWLKCWKNPLKRSFQIFISSLKICIKSILSLNNYTIDQSINFWCMKIRQEQENNLKLLIPWMNNQTISRSPRK